MVVLAKARTYYPREKLWREAGNHESSPNHPLWLWVLDQRSLRSLVQDDSGICGALLPPHHQRVHDRHALPFRVHQHRVELDLRDLLCMLRGKQGDVGDRLR